MDLNILWKVVVIVIGGILILRLAGRKSISQLTVAQTVIMIAVGSLIIQPVSENNVWVSMLITLLMIVTLIIVEYIVLKFDVAESFIYGKSVLVVDNGQLVEKNLKQLRLTVDMLEVRLRQHNVHRISDLQWATIESNGQLGYSLKPEKQNATKEDIQLLMSALKGNQPLNKNQSNLSDDIFVEVKNKNHSRKPPERLN
ncbi:DUF421 domain-containing protein [Halalkalibacillus sediminis]|uniref:DUF421 domain-containing protein n=1 Tax=Halalkalibacillus sediminis TaxID=2018042 RepID=A0A2I0QR00_9BACI|nr:DUF421 domain-containing protein [Halalkalibacillus sediminis]PKR76749.1 DUF421 domain-containing protein [Halalkalibacillus sediminis]